MKGKGTEEDKGTMQQCSLHHFPLQESGGVGFYLSCSQLESQARQESQWQSREKLPMATLQTQDVISHSGFNYSFLKKWC